MNLILRGFIYRMDSLHGTDAITASLNTCRSMEGALSARIPTPRKGYVVSRECNQENPSVASIKHESYATYVRGNCLSATVGRLGDRLRSVQPSCTRSESSAPTSTLKTTPLPISRGNACAGWLEFAAAISGEWDGYCADFDGDLGLPNELPESVVPQTFREWELKIFAWQMQGPTLATPDVSGQLYNKTIRLLPTVGCEADAATPHSVEERHTGPDRAANVESAATGLLAYSACGCYSIGWPGYQKNAGTYGQGTAVSVTRTQDPCSPVRWEVEHCFIADQKMPRGEKFRSRIRIQQQLEGAIGSADGDVPRVRQVTVYREAYEGPFRNGESLGGCGSSESGSAEAPRLTLKQWLSGGEGQWEAEDSGISLEGVDPPPTHAGPPGVAMELLPQDATTRVPVSSPPSTEGILLLPKGVWSQVALSTQGKLQVTAGWLVEADRVLVSTWTYGSEGHLEAIQLSRRRKKP